MSAYTSIHISREHALRLFVAHVMTDLSDECLENILNDTLREKTLYDINITNSDTNDDSVRLYVAP